MQWPAKSDPVKSVEFYRMLVQANFGKGITHQVYQGAVVFGAPRAQGCEVLRILTPMPSPETLYAELAKVHASRLRERMIFLEWDSSQVMLALQQFVGQGLPLPDVFNESMVRFEGFTVFQLACYQQTCRIPHGETKPYAWLAARLKKYGAERAVGRAMKTNPFPLFVPCHRVVKKDGNLGGYMGTVAPDSWQIGLKKSLLEIEGLHQQPSLFAPTFETMLQ